VTKLREARITSTINSSPAQTERFIEQLVLLYSAH